MTYHHICLPGCACMGEEPAPSPFTGADDGIARHLATCQLEIARCWICSTEFGLVPGPPITVG